MAIIGISGSRFSEYIWAKKEFLGYFINIFFSKDVTKECKDHMYDD